MSNNNDNAERPNETTPIDGEDVLYALVMERAGIDDSQDPTLNERLRGLEKAVGEYSISLIKLNREIRKLVCEDINAATTKDFADVKGQTELTIACLAMALRELDALHGVIKRELFSIQDKEGE